jgi:ribonuclease J
VHGEYRHLKAQAKLVRELGIAKENIFILQSGDVLELTPDSAEVTDSVPVGNILVDGLGVGDVGNIVLRDRQHLAEDGIVIVTFAMESGTEKVVSVPEITSRGFVYIKEADVLMNGANLVAQGALFACQERRTLDRNRIKAVVRDNLSDYFWKKTQRRPMILPIIVEIGRDNY